jgi:hypothetical protein
MMLNGRTALDQSPPVVDRAAVKNEAMHHWPEEEATQRIEPKLRRRQRIVRFMQEAFILGGVDRNFGTPRNQDPMRNVLGVGVVGDVSRSANSVDKPQD